MLSPEQISNIGNNAVRITQQEIDALVSMVSGEIAAAIKRGDSYKSLLNKSLDVEQQAMREMLQNDSELRDVAVRTVVDALSEQLDDDLERIGVALADLPPEILVAMHQSTAATAQGVREIVRRENLAMADNVRQGFFTVSSKYIAMVNAGGIKTEDAVKRAVLELADKGIDTVQYKSGARAQADVAIRRHLASQVTQVGGKRVMQIMNTLDVELVEVSSHIGARPSHAEWQGKCYSMHGRMVLDGVVYEDFGLATGYFGQGPNGALGDRLQGVNCRHFFGPYLHGQPRTYSETPDEDAGYERGEVYKNTQKQRAYEREIRRTKRRIAALEGAGLKDTPEHTIERIKLGDLQRALKKHVDAHEYLTRRYGRERVSELEKQPRARKTVNPKSSSSRRAETKPMKDPVTRSGVTPESGNGKTIQQAKGIYIAYGRDVASEIVRVVDSASMSDDKEVQLCARLATVVSQRISFEVDNRGSCFRQSRRRMYLAEGENQVRDFFHEIFHAADFCSSNHYKSRFWRKNGSTIAGHLSADYQILQELAAAQGVDVKDYILMKLGRKNTEALPIQYSGFSDMAEAASSGELYFGYGHILFDKKYWEYYSGQIVSMEMVANYGQAIITSKEARKAFELAFPKASQAALDYLRFLGEEFL